MRRLLIVSLLAILLISLPGVALAQQQNPVFATRQFVRDTIAKFNQQVVDPLADAVAGLQGEMDDLEERVETLEAKQDGRIDISGNWNITLASGLTCSAEFSQSGTSLSESFDCGGGLVGSVTGTIDTQTGQFALTGSHSFADKVNSVGAAPDGSFMAGTVSATVGSSATTEIFIGTRKAPVGG